MTTTKKVIIFLSILVIVILFIVSYDPGEATSEEVPPTNNSEHIHELDITDPRHPDNVIPKNVPEILNILKEAP